MPFILFCSQAKYGSASYSLLILFPDIFECSQSPKRMRPKRSSLPCGIPVLFAIKEIERREETMENWQRCHFYLRKGFISLWLVLYSIFSSVSHSLLFQLWALILNRLVPLEWGKNPATAVCPSWDSFQVQANLKRFLLFCSVMHWTEIALDNLLVILWEPLAEKRELQVSNDPLNASSTINYRNSFLIWLFPVRLCELSFIRQ